MPMLRWSEFWRKFGATLRISESLRALTAISCALCRGAEGAGGHQADAAAPHGPGAGRRLQPLLNIGGRTQPCILNI